MAVKVLLLSAGMVPRGAAVVKAVMAIVDWVQGESSLEVLGHM
jgi:hypothetical protein